jgi:cell division initiation protein
MKITPLDIQNHRFKKTLRGYDRQEVEIFLEMVAGEYENLIKENNYLGEELSRKKTELAEYREREQTLKDTMITAQRIAQDMKQNVAKEAQIILSEAEMEADRIIKKAHERVISLQDEISDLKRQRLRAEEDLRGMLTTHLKLLDIASEEEAETAATEDKVSLMPSKKPGGRE